AAGHLDVTLDARAGQPPDLVAPHLHVAVVAGGDGADDRHLAEVAEARIVDVDCQQLLPVVHAARMLDLLERAIVVRKVERAQPGAGAVIGVVDDDQPGNAGVVADGVALPAHPRAVDLDARLARVAPAIALDGVAAQAHVGVVECADAVGAVVGDGAVARIHRAAIPRVDAAAAVGRRGLAVLVEVTAFDGGEGVAAHREAFGGIAHQERVLDRESGVVGTLDAGAARAAYREVSDQYAPGARDADVAEHAVGPHGALADQREVIAVDGH